MWSETICMKQKEFPTQVSQRLQADQICLDWKRLVNFDIPLWYIIAFLELWKRNHHPLSLYGKEQQRYFTKHLFLCSMDVNKSGLQNTRWVYSEFVFQLKYPFNSLLFDIILAEIFSAIKRGSQKVIELWKQNTLPFRSLGDFLRLKWILLFSKNSLNWLKVKVKLYIVTKTYIYFE